MAHLAVQLRGSIRRLRSVKSSAAGSLATGRCRSFWLEDVYGVPPRSRPEDVAGFIQFWSDFVSITDEVKKTASQHAEPYQSCKPWIVRKFVLTHHDLAPRTLMLDHSGHLWLLDWELTGFYPKSFEYAAMHNFMPNADWNKWARFKWQLFTHVVAGHFKREARALEIVRSQCTSWTAGRRSNIIATGTAVDGVVNLS